MSKVYTVKLDEHEAAALKRMAYNERRSPSKQIAAAMREILVRRRYLTDCYRITKRPRPSKKAV